MIILICFSKSAMHRIHCVCRPLWMITTSREVVTSNQKVVTSNIARSCWQETSVHCLISFSHFILRLKDHWYLLQQFLYSTITSTLLHRQYKFTFSRSNRKPLRYLIGLLFRLDCNMLFQITFQRYTKRYTFIQKLRHIITQIAWTQCLTAFNEK